MSLAIQIGTDYLDIAPEQDFFITKQIHDITSLETRNGDFTKILSLPTTEKNLTILEVNDTELQNELKAVVTLNGITIASNAKIFYDNVNKKTLETEIKVNNGDLFSRINRPLRELDLSAYNFTLSVNGADAIKQTTSGVIYCRADWFDKETSDIMAATDTVKEFDGAIDVNLGGFFFYCKTLFEEIMSQAGYTLVTDLDNSTFDTLALVCPVPDFLRLPLPDIFALVTNTGVGIQTFTATGRIQFVVDTDPGAIWSVGNDEYSIAAQERVTIEISYGTLGSAWNILFPNNYFGTPKINLKADDITLRSSIIDNTINVFHNANMKVDFYAEVATKIYLEVEIPAVKAGVLTVNIQEGILFRVYSQQTNPTDAITVASRMPDMRQDEFIKNIMTLFNLVLDVDSTSGNAFLDSFDNLYTHEEQDLTLNLMNNLPQNKINNSGFFRNNIFKFSGDEKVSDSNAILDDLRLKEEGILIELAFNSPGGSELFIETGRINAYNANIIDNDTTINVASGTSNFTLSFANELRVGDWLSVIGAGTRRIATLSSSTVGTVTGTWTNTLPTAELSILQFSDNDIGPTVINIINKGVSTLNITDGDLSDNTKITGNKSANVNIDMRFSSLIGSDYTNLLSSLNNYLRVEAWLLLNELEFNELDLTRPFYFQQFNAHFFMSILEQWRPEKPTRVQLFRL